MQPYIQMLGGIGRRSTHMKAMCGRQAAEGRKARRHEEE